MTEAAAAFVDALDGAQRAKASFAFEDEVQRTSWAYFPRNHAGLPLHEMDIRQQKLAHALVSGSLSLHAYAKATAIMALESVLNEIEGRRADAVRDPGRYFISVFGEIGVARWGWRLEGHHVCLNFTLLDGEIAAATPLFFGANPAEVRDHGHAVTRPCGEEEDASRELLASLDADQRREAVICEVAPPDFVLTNAPEVPAGARPGEVGDMVFIRRQFEAMSDEHKDALRFDRARPAGLAASRMTLQQQALLDELVRVYIDRLPEPLAMLERGRIGPAGEMRFAWAGPSELGAGHYYRLQGRSFLVEYDNTQDDANHVHAVWRSPGRDFALDALRAHVVDAH